MKLKIRKPVRGEYLTSFSLNGTCIGTYDSRTKSLRPNRGNAWVAFRLDIPEHCEAYAKMYMWARREMMK